MKDEKYTIGEFSSLTGISKDTLRFYDKMGVLQPKFIGESSRYRYYTFDQLWYADMVVSLQRLGVPLQTIVDVFATKSDQMIIELLKLQREEALRMSEYFMRLADDIEWYARQQRILENGALSETNAAVTVEYFTQREVLYYRYREEDEDDLDIRTESKGESFAAELKETDSVKRVRGFVIDGQRLVANDVSVLGSYIDIGMSDFNNVAESERTVIPAGEYACFVAEFIDQNADLTPLIEWLKDNGKVAEYVVMDNLGLNFFDHDTSVALYEIKVFLR